MPAPIGPDAIAVTENAHRVAVDIDVSGLSTRLENEAMRLIKEGTNAGLQGQELTDFVDKGLKALSDAPIDKAGRGAASEGFNLGRNLEAQRRQGEIGEVVRTEILDANTCPPCRRLDGQRFRFNSPEYLANMPPAKCEGRELCRGFYIYLGFEAAEAA